MQKVMLKDGVKHMRMGMLFCRGSMNSDSPLGTSTVMKVGAKL